VNNHLKKHPNILILGKMPPPIGGVTVHVERLLGYLEKNGFCFRFLKINILNLLLIKIHILRYKIIHLHTSNIYVMLWVCLTSNLLFKKLIITFHGDLNRYNDRDLKIVKLILKHTTIPVLLNKGSFETAIKINNKSLLISAFIPPFNEKPLSKDIINKIYKLKKDCEFVFATNASSLTYDKFNNEIYGIIDLIKYFKSNNNLALIISDPSSKYKEFIELNNIALKPNILLINDSHSFFEVLNLVNASIRNTSTDGDSLSVRESIFLGKLTFATDVVSRPKGTITYSRGSYKFSSYQDFVNEFQDTKNQIKLPNYNLILDVYKSL